MANSKRKVADAGIVVENDGKKLLKTESCSVTTAATITTTAQDLEDTATSSNAATQAVLYTTELLEAILLRLHPLYIFRTQRVCHKFRDTINGSDKLQKRLFIRPCEEPQSWVVRRTAAESSSDAHRSRFELVLAADGVANTVTEPVLPVKLCPLVPPRATTPFAFSSSVSKVQGTIDLNMLDLLAHPGSWQQMLLTDPPCSRAMVLVMTFLDTRPTGVWSGERFTLLSSDIGLTLGDVARCVLRMKPAVKCGGSRSVADLMEEGKMGGAEERTGLLKKLKVNVTLEDVIVPSDEEWDRVARRAEASPPESS